MGLETGLAVLEGLLEIVDEGYGPFETDGKSHRTRRDLLGK